MEFSGADGEFFKVVRQGEVAAPVVENLTTSLRWGFPAKEFITNKDGQKVKMIEIFPTGFRKKMPEFVLQGSSRYFDEILGSIKEFSGK